MAPTSTSTRLHGLDALRATALGLGIVLHSLLPFAPGVPWLVTDSESSALATPVAGVIHLFRMVLFMLLAGYFGRMVLHRRGARAYLRDRTIRILLPVVAFWPVAVLPLGLLTLLALRLQDVEVPVLTGDTSWVDMIVPGHLWFLLVLMECALITVAVRAVVRRVAGADRVTRLGERVGALLASPAGVAAAALPYVGCLLLQGSAAGGILEPTTVVPEIAPLVGYLGAFVVGWCLHSSGSLARLGATWPAHLGAALLLTAAVLGFGDVVPLGLGAVLTALAGWTWTYGLVGLFCRHLTRERPVVRYLADASYWAYLMHLPLLLAVEIPLVDLHWPVLAKLALTWVVTAVVLLLSYDLLVRDTVIGRWLNGHRRPSVLRPRRATVATA